MTVSLAQGASTVQDWDWTNHQETALQHTTVQLVKIHLCHMRTGKSRWEGDLGMNLKFLNGYMQMQLAFSFVEDCQNTFIYPPMALN